MTTPFIEMTDCCKKYKETVALNNVSVCFDAGKIHGIIGRNGSGKSVLFKCLCGFTPLTSGSIRINGLQVRSGKCPIEFGAIIETPGFLENRSGYDNLCLLASIRKKITHAHVRETIKLVGLDPDSKKHVSKYSMGMRQRLAIAQAIMEQPPLLILDEPMNGLDKQGIQNIRNLLLHLRNDGITILVASHYAEDINYLCDTVCEMNQGQLHISKA